MCDTKLISIPYFEERFRMRIITSKHRARDVRAFVELIGMAASRVPVSQRSLIDDWPPNEKVAYFASKSAREPLLRSLPILVLLGAYGIAKAISGDWSSLQGKAMAVGPFVTLIAFFSAIIVVTSTCRRDWKETSINLVFGWEGLWNLVLEATLLCSILFSCYLVFYRGFVQPFTAPGGVSLGGLSMAIIFLAVGLVVANGIDRVITLQRGLLVGGPDSAVRVVELIEGEAS